MRIVLCSKFYAPLFLVHLFKDFYTNLTKH